MRWPPPPWRDLRVALAVVASLAAAVYLNSLSNRFAYDDYHIVVNNTGIQSLQTLPGALAEPYWPGRYGRELGLWRPTTSAVLGLGWIAGDGEPFVFHALNVVGHAVVSALVLLLLAELMSLPAALAGALVFAVHPVHVEAVANVIGLSEILSTLFVLAACLVHVRGGAHTGWGRAAAIGALYALAFGSKESAITLLGVLFVLDAAGERLGPRDLPAYLARRWRLYAVLVAVAAVVLLGRVGVLGSVASPFGPLGADILQEIPRIWTLGEVWMHYARLWVFPLDLSSDYSPDVIPISTGWHAANLTGLLLALAVLSSALLAWRREPMSAGRDSPRAAGFGVVWFMVALSPVSNALFLAGVLLAERTLYLPSVGLAAATGWLVVRAWRERPRLAAVALAAALLLGSVRTWTRSPTWKDNPTMLTTLIDEYPHSGRSQWILGDVLLMRGRVSEGLLAYRAAINLLGTHYQLVTEVARKLIDAGFYSSADGLLHYAQQQDPEFSLAPALRAAIHAELGDPVRTERFAREAIAIDSFDPARHYLLAWALAAQGRLPEAAASRATAEGQGRADFWQRWMLDAHLSWTGGDTLAARASLDSAWAHAGSDPGRAYVDSLGVALFGAPPRALPRTEPEAPENR